MTAENYRFDIALSFAGDNKRDRVRAVAESLANVLGRERIFFHEWYEDELAGLDANTVLANIYARSSRLVVTCVCKRYGEKSWTQDEWRAIQSLERTIRDGATNNLERLRLLPLRFEDGDVDGIYSTAIVPDVRTRSVSEIVELILSRLDKINGRTVPRSISVCAQGEAVMRQVFAPLDVDGGSSSGRLHYRIFDVKDQNNFVAAKKLVLAEATEPEASITDLQVWSVLGRYELIVRYRCPEGVDLRRATLERLKLIGATCNHNLRISHEFSVLDDFTNGSGTAHRVNLAHVRDNFGATVFILIDYRQLSDAHADGWFVEQVLDVIKRDPMHFSVVLAAKEDGHRMVLELVVPCGRLRALNRLSAAFELLFAGEQIKSAISKETLIGYEAYDLFGDSCVRYDF